MRNRDALIYLHSLFLNEDYYNSILEMENLADVFLMDKKDLMNIPNATKRSVEKILNNNKRDDISKFLEYTYKNTTEIFTIYDDDYPFMLRYIERAPKVLFARGLPLNLENVRLGFVGARKCTAYGMYAVKHFVGELSKYNVTIISGMAQGIDACSHRAALDNDLYTIGVLGTGVDIKFPASNAGLYEKMYERGTLVSEYPLGTTAKPFYFPERNRIISGLSDGVIVAEAKEKSGSLITARLAAEQGREVFSIPGNINSIYSKGTNGLIRDGAIPLLDISDIEYAIPEILNGEKCEEEKAENFYSDDEKLILEKIDQGINTIDKICEATKMDINKISSTITLLEMKGVIADMKNMGFKRI